MRYKQAAGVVARAVAGEDVLVPLGGPAKRVFTLSRTGKALWDRLAAWAATPELEAVLVERFGGASGQVRDDVVRFLADLQRFGLVEVDTGATEVATAGRARPNPGCGDGDAGPGGVND